MRAPSCAANPTCAAGREDHLAGQRAGVLDLNELPRWIGQIYDLNCRESRPTDARARGPELSEPRADDGAGASGGFCATAGRVRGAESEAARRQGRPVAITAALRGAGGYGKTTLAKALAHDPDIEDAYFDGILWAELGEKPENLLSIVADLIEILNGERPGLENLNSAAAKLGEALGDRRILLVIDDVWREQDLRPFCQGGRNTTRLITTRRDDILPPKAERQAVDAMAANEALSLLVRACRKIKRRRRRRRFRLWRSGLANGRSF